jgi:hypothetical protein
VIAFVDTETIRIEPGPNTMWALATILRDTEGPDREMLWHIRPDTGDADPMALRLNRYYERCRARSLPVSWGYLVEDSERAESDDWSTADALRGTEVAAHVADVLHCAVLIGANVGAFDVPHIDQYLRGNDECLVVDYHYLDIGSLVLGWALGGGTWSGGDPLKLRHCIEMAGLDQELYPAHEAMSDARAVRDIWDVISGCAR